MNDIITLYWQYDSIGHIKVILLDPCSHYHFEDGVVALLSPYFEVNFTDK
jgi:hypothetical protein